MKEKYLYMLHATSILHQVVADHPEILTAWCFRPMPITPSSTPSHGVCVCVCVCVTHSVMFQTLRPYGLACQAPLPMDHSRQEYYCGLPFPFPWNLPNPGIEPGFPPLQADSLPSEPPGNPLVMIWLLICTFLHRVLIRAPLPCHESSFWPCGTHDLSSINHFNLFILWTFPPTHPFFHLFLLAGG